MMYERIEEYKVTNMKKLKNSQHCRKPEGIGISTVNQNG